MKEKILNEVENILAKREIPQYAHYEQCLLLPQFFPKSSDTEASERVCHWERPLRVKIQTKYSFNAH